MESAVLFFKGVIIGFIINILIGAIGIICIQRTLRKGWRSGFISGMGAAFADVAAAAVVGFSLTIVSTYIIRVQWWLRLIGGMFIIAVGIKSLVNNSTKKRKIMKGKLAALSDFGSTFFLTITNPATFLVFIAIFVGFNLVETTNYFMTSFLITGIFLGALLNWVIVIGITELFVKKFSKETIRRLNKIGSLLIILFGLLAVISSLGSYLWEVYSVKLSLPWE